MQPLGTFDHNIYDELPEKVSKRENYITGDFNQLAIGLSHPIRNLQLLRRRFYDFCEDMKSFFDIWKYYDREDD